MRVDSYMLRCVVTEYGEPTKYWDKFEKHYRGRNGKRMKMRAWNTDNDCKRRCMTNREVDFLESRCEICSSFCDGRGDIRDEDQLL